MVGVASNISALTALTHLQRNQKDLSQAMQRLATGKKINSGKDDPAGLIAVQFLRRDISAARVEQKIVKRAEASANITEGQMSELSGMMNELRSLTIEAANSGAFSNAEIAANQMQADYLVNSIQTFGNAALRSLEKFNMGGDGNAKVRTQIQDAMAQAATLASNGSNSLTSGNFDGAEAALDSATTAVATARAHIGAYQRYELGPRLRVAETAEINLEASRSRIEDADFAVEVSNMIRAQILTDVSIKVLAIANQQARNILVLLGG